MATARPCPRCARFDQFEVDLAAGELRKSGQRIPLQDQPFQILRLLIEAAPEVVSREQISSVLWPSDTFVDFDLAINTAVKKLRQALDDSVDDPKFIQTVAKRGYRFNAKVDWIEDSGKSSVVARNGDSQGARSPRKRLALASLGFVAITLAWMGWSNWPRPEPILTAIPLTAFPGGAGWPSLSPDGQQVAFGQNSNVGSSLFVQSIGGAGPPQQLTHAAGFLYSWVSAWSPDGKWIAYERYNPKPEQRPIEMVLTPTPAGGPEIVVQRTNGGECGLSWSPDGKYLAFVDSNLPQEPHAIYLLDRETSRRRRLTNPPKETLGGDAYPEFSHDGKQLAFVRNLNGMVQIAVLTLATDHVKTLVSERAVVGGIAWDPADKNIIFGAILTGSSRLWRISAAGGTPRPLGVGEDGWAPSVSEKTHRLTYAQGAGDTNIWRIRFGKDKGETRTPLIASTRQEVQPELSPDESKVVFSSDRSGAVEIWVSDSDGNNPMQVTHLETFNTGRPHWSPDGTQIAFESGARGKPDVYLVGLDGADPRRLTDDNFEDSAPTWSADGKWIYYQSNRSGQIQIWRMSSQGDRAVQLTNSGGLSPVAGPDGKHLYYLNSTTNNQIWVMDLPAGKEQRVPSVPNVDDPGSYRVTSDGIYFTTPDSSGSNDSSLRFYSFATGKTQVVTRLGNMIGAQGISISRNGRTILYSQQDHVNMNIMLVENFH
jgi:Tol biopolymer transport system component/DNA-binding winged helix-turn-helix (wHTH) protein